MAVQKTLAAFLLIFTISCSTGYDFSKMPRYSMDQAISNYQGLSNAEIVYRTLTKAFFRLENLGITIDKTDIFKAVDIYIYWSSVANIQLFHGDYLESDQSLLKAIEGLEQFKQILIDIMAKSNI